MNTERTTIESTTDILDRLRDLLERGVSAPADAVLADAVAEIERLREDEPHD